MANSMIFYESFKKAIDNISDPFDALKSYEAIIGYALTGEVPELDGIPCIVFDMAKPQIDANTKRRENGNKGGRPRKKTADKKPLVSKTTTTTKPLVFENDENKKPNVNVNVNVNDNVNSNKRFSPPSVSEVQAYCTERNNNVNAEQFVDFYTSKGWKVGSNPMKDWKACVRTWERNHKDKPVSPVTNTKIHNFQERKYDFAALESRLVQN